MYCSGDAEANDMIHIESDHKSVTNCDNSTIKTVENTKSEKQDPMKQSSSKSATQNLKEKSSMKPKLQPPHRKELSMLGSQHKLTGMKTQMQQHTIRMSTQTPQPLSLSTRMEDLLQKSQQRVIRMPTRSPQ